MEENNKIDQEKLANDISEKVTKEIKKNMPKTSLSSRISLIKDIVLVALIIVGVIFAINFTNNMKMNTSIIDPVSDRDVTISNGGILGYKAADFEDAIIGSASKKADLIVDEQELSVVSTVTQTGLFNLGILSKNQTVTYYGTAQYTVDLSKFTKDNINVDMENHTITVRVPHPELHDIVFNPSKTVFGATEKGILAFGDIKMSQEESNKVEVEAVERLTARALEKDCMDKADKYALYAVRDFFESSITSITNSFKVKVELAD